MTKQWTELQQFPWPSLVSIGTIRVSIASPNYDNDNVRSLPGINRVCSYDSQSVGEPSQRVEVELDSVGNRIRAIRVYHGSRLMDEPAISDEWAGTGLLNIARTYPDALLCWFDFRALNYLSPRETWGGLIRHPLEIRFFPGPPDDQWRQASLGFAAHYSAFVFPMRDQQVVPAVLISPIAGVCHAQLLASFENPNKNLELMQVLAEVGRLSMFSGVCSYADSRLFDNPDNLDKVRRLTQESWRDIAGLVASQYSRRSLLPWLLGVVIYYRRLPLLSVIRALRRPTKLIVDQSRLAQLLSGLPLPDPSDAIEVVIPTLERPTYLLRILQDLKEQDLLPKRVHIVAQREGSIPPEIADTQWPFQLHIQQVQWVGVCRARNLGVDAVESKWVALIDDDLRLPANYLKDMLALAIKFHVEAVNAIPAETQIVGTPPHLTVWTWRHFLSGFALCTRRIFEATGGFQKHMEGIIYEDFELGVRIRQAGTHVMVTRQIAVVNEGAPVGGFRSDNISQLGPKEFPSLAIYLSLSPSMSDAMRLGFRMQYLLEVLQSKSWWRWPMETKRLVTEWEKAQKWYDGGG